MIKRTLVCLAVFGVMASGSLLAHHSLAGVYDMKKEAEVSGTLTTTKVGESPRVAYSRGEEGGWLDSRVGILDRFRHHPRAKRDRRARTECPQVRGRPDREIHPGEGRQSVGVSQVDYHGRRARALDLCR